mmetsp:Transcript_6399/g.15071  ORF Transcript_6399/g.15071 Transcript_6399/m.15071 type:complete len:200 (+) Transcript_6399:151-750(+)
MRDRICERLVQPDSFIVVSISSYSRRIIRETPCSPPTARAYTAGRANMTALAPSPTALKMSVPRRIPPSMKMGICPRTSSAIAGSTSIVAGTESSCRPPWLDTTMAAAPALMASLASSGCMTPLAMMGRLQIDFSQAMMPQSRVRSFCASNSTSCWFTTFPSIWMFGSCPIASDVAYPVRRSRSRRPVMGASTVRHKAL